MPSWELGAPLCSGMIHKRTLLQRASFFLLRNFWRWLDVDEKCWLGSNREESLLFICRQHKFPLSSVLLATSGSLRASHSFPGCWVKPSAQADLWIVVRSFLLLGGIKVTWAHVPAWAESRHGAVSNTENKTCGCVDTSLCVCIGVFPDPTALWAVFPLTYLLHPQTSPSLYMPNVSTSLLPFQNAFKGFEMLCILCSVLVQFVQPQWDQCTKPVYTDRELAFDFLFKRIQLQALRYQKPHSCRCRRCNRREAGKVTEEWKGRLLPHRL